MMTDRDERFRSEDPLEELASDVWGVQKAISAMTDEEQRLAWYQAVDVLNDFGKLAETLHNDALILAVTDAMVRAREELNRVVYRLDRTEGAEMQPQEEERLRRLLRRSDALCNAWVVMHDERTIGGLQTAPTTVRSWPSSGRCARRRTRPSRATAWRSGTRTSPLPQRS